MAFIERGVGLRHGFLEKAAHLLRPAPHLTPLDWFRTASNGFPQAAVIQTRSDVLGSDSGFRGVLSGATDGISSAANGFYLSGTGNYLQERSFADGLLVHGDEAVVGSDIVGARRNGRNTSTGGKKGAAGGSSSAVVKGQWTAEEDSLLLKLVKQHGVRKWSVIAQHLVGRIGKQCRERWHNHLRPDIKKDTWSEEEEKLLVESHEKVGNKWAEIAKRIPGRTENSIKNHWNATKRRQNSRRKSRKTTAAQSGKTQPSVLQDYIRSIYYSKEAINVGPATINNNSSSKSSNHLTELVCPNQSYSTSTNDHCLRELTTTVYKDEDHLLQHYFYGDHHQHVQTYNSPPADSSMGSSRPQESMQLGVEQLEQVLLSDESALVETEHHHLMDMDELAFFAPSPILDYFSDNSCVLEDAATTTAGTTPRSTTTTSGSTYLNSDLYISYLLNGSYHVSGTSSCEEEIKMNIPKFPIEEDEAFPNRREEMDLIEMVSSSQILQSR